LEGGVRRWLEDNEAGKESWDHKNVHVIYYEQLIINFESSINDITTFIGEVYDGSIIDYYKAKKVWYSNKHEKPLTAFVKDHKQHRDWQINQPLFDGRVRWKELSAEELSYIQEVAGPMLL